MSARILLLDIETAPILGAVWDIWNQNVSLDAIKEDWHILCYAASWLGEEEVIYDALNQYPKTFKQDHANDYNILLTLRELLDEADIVIAHNGDRFDIPKINARFLAYGIEPPSPYRTIDTLKVARKIFKLTSNKLDYIAKFLKVGGKSPTGGMKLWMNCLAGDAKAWETMIKYNINDVAILEAVYLKLRPWMKNHPNLGLYTVGVDPVCPKCASDKLQWRGYAYTSIGAYRRFQCTDCGGWGRERISSLTPEKRKGVVTNA